MMIIDNEVLNSRIMEYAIKRAVCGYTWENIADQINNEFGTLLTGDACRKRASRCISSQESSVCIDDDNSACDLSQVGNSQFQRDLRIQELAQQRRIDREQSLIAMAQTYADELSKKKPFTSTDVMYTSKEKNEALLLISDWHYGVEIHNCFNKYDPEVCEQRVHELLLDVIKRIKRHGISKLYVLNLGDMIAGIIHLQLRINSQMDVTTQTMRVTEIIAEFLYELSKYVDVEYYQVLDNHSRIDPNKKESLQLESLARFTQWGLKLRFENIKKPYHTIKINDNALDPNIAAFYVCDELLIAGVHGDMDKKAMVMQKLNNFYKEKIDIVCSAHLHHFSMDEDNRTTLISNGSLMGTDEYAFNLRLDSFPSQTLVTFKETPMGADIDAIYKLNSYMGQ